MNTKENESNENKIVISKGEDGAYQIFVDYAFETKTEITERTILISEAFGLGIDETKTFKIYDNFSFKFRIGDIVLINGDSGGGKSLLLREVFKKLPNAISVDDLKIDENEVIINGVGKNLNDALFKLNVAGLGDAFLYSHKYSQLSDGQKYRYKIAKFIDQEDKDIWLLDEFCATLDRTTAKIVAYNLQKIARKLNKTVVTITTHTDLVDEIRPNIHIRKGYESDVDIIYYTHKYWKDKKLDMLNDIKVEKGTRQDYDALKKYHYRQAGLGSLKAVYKMSYREELIGVIVICYPRPSLKGRNLYFTDGRFRKMSKETMHLLNGIIDYIARVVLHPKFRGCGLTKVFLQKYFKLTTASYAESLSVMSNYNPFFVHGGFQRIDVPEDKKRNEMVAQLEKYGFNTLLLSSSRYCKNIFEKLNKENQDKVRVIVKSILNKYKGAISKLQGKSIDDVVETNDNLFMIMKELNRANTVYVIKKLRD